MQDDYEQQLPKNLIIYYYSMLRLAVRAAQAVLVIISTKKNGWGRDGSYRKVDMYLEDH